MRKIILSMMVSLDGYTEGSNPEDYWHNWDDEMAEYMMSFFSQVDTFIYGRKAYEDMIAYWPQLADDFAKVMNDTPKLVFSKTLKKTDWNAKIISDDPSIVIPKLKEQPGKDMVVFAGSNLAAAFIEHGLIDEYRIILNPLVLGGKKPLFPDLKDILQLRLKDTRTFDCGNVLLIYEPNDK